MALIAIVFSAWLSQPPADEKSREPYTAEKTDQERYVGQFVTSQDKFNPWRDSYAQWAMAIVSVAATGFSIWAVFIVRDTLTETRKAVKAADDAVRETRRIGEAQVRAYIAIGNISVTKFKKGFSPVLSYKIKNVGQTPARRFRMDNVAQIVQGDISAEKFYFGKDRFSGPIMDIAPGGDSTTSTNIPVSDEDIDAVVAGSRNIVFWGVLKYESVFGRLHRVVFCAHVIGVKDDTLIFGPAHVHNKAD